jgi:hypothetical protein
MKAAITINLPVETVAGLFTNANHFNEWKKDFVSFAYVSGTPGNAGAVTQLVFKRVTMFETIIAANLPASFTATYDHQRNGKTVMVHEATNRFSTIKDNATLIESEMTMTKVVGLLPRIIMTLMGGAAKKYAQGQFERFKIFAEKKTGLQ